MKKLTKLIANLLIVISALALNPIGASAEWKQNSSGEWTYSERNSNVKGWKLINGKWYFFGLVGTMVHDANVDGYNIGPDGTIINKSTISSDNDVIIDSFANVNLTFALRFGSAKIKDDWIYFQHQNFTIYNPDGINKTTYYGYGIYKIKTDGTGLQRLVDSTKFIGTYTIENDWIYFYSDSKIYKVKTDGTEQQEVCDSRPLPNALYVENGVIYILNSPEIHKVNSDGTGDTTLVRKEHELITNIIVNDGYIYYRTTHIAQTGVLKPDGATIRRMKTDGSEDTLLADLNINTKAFKTYSYFCIKDGWIYYEDNINDSTDILYVGRDIYKMKLDGSEKTKCNVIINSQIKFSNLKDIVF